MITQLMNGKKIKRIKNINKNKLLSNSKMENQENEWFYNNSMTRFYETGKINDFESPWEINEAISLEDVSLEVTSSTTKCLE